MSSIALSLSWNADLHTQGDALMRQLEPLGFTHFELSFGLTAQMVEEILRFQQERGITVVSAHNYCPIPDGVSRQDALPDCFSLSSLDETERARAVAFTKRSIDTVKRFCGSVLVLHCGRVEIEDFTKALMRLYDEGKADSGQFQAIRQQMIKERQAKKEPFLDAIMKSMDELSRYAQDNGVNLGVENRIYHREIPLFEEVGLFLERFKKRGVFYWHDVGHAQVLETLGFARHEEYLQRYGDAIIGFHLHDVSGIKDHRAPSQGNLDFTMLKPYLTKDRLKVLETHQPATAEDILAGVRHLKGIFDGAL